MTNVTKVSPGMIIGDGIADVTFTPLTLTLTFTYASGDTTQIHILPLIANLIADSEGAVTTALLAARTGIAIINPALGSEKNGDIRIANDIGYIRSDGDWKQVWPAIE